MPSSAFTYCRRFAENPVVGFGKIGSLLDTFSVATTWKAYFVGHISPFIKGRVLEVGAGIGTTTAMLCEGRRYESWSCLEPDAELLRQLSARRAAGNLPEYCEPVSGTLSDLPNGTTFDTVLYIDVLEHIEDDRGELAAAAKFVAPEGHLMVVSPSHNWLYTSFDFAVGHFRRYNRKMLRTVAPTDLVPAKLFYLDSVGLFASLANKLVLHQVEPTRKQLMVWDRVLVPLSKLFDPLLGYNFGKQIIAIWKRP